MKKRFSIVMLVAALGGTISIKASSTYTNIINVYQQIQNLYNGYQNQLKNYQSQLNKLLLNISLEQAESLNSDQRNSLMNIMQIQRGVTRASNGYGYNGLQKNNKNLFKKLRLLEKPFIQKNNLRERENNLRKREFDLSIR